MRGKCEATKTYLFNFLKKTGVALTIVKVQPSLCMSLGISSMCYTCKHTRLCQVLISEKVV